MKKSKIIFDNVHVFSPDMFKDERGYFFESYNANVFNNLLSSDISFVQDSHSFTKKYVLRGLHFQSNPYEQDKLVRVVKGEIFDVVVDIRQESKTFGSWHGEVLSSDNNLHIWIPKGFAHGFIATSDEATVLYKTTEYYHPECEKTIKYDDPDLDIKWPLEVKTVSAKDSDGIPFKDLYLR